MFVIPNVDSLVEKYNLPKITSPNIWIDKKSEEYDPEGIFSPTIFGLPGSEKYRSQFAYIDLQLEFLHPAILDIIASHSRHLSEAILGTTVIYTDGIKIYTKNDEGNLEALQGYELVKYLVENYQNLQLNPVIKEAFQKYQNNLLITKLIVIPPAYRPIYHIKDMVVIDAINSYYTQIIQHISTLTESTWFIIQSKLYRLYKHLQQSLAKKTGLIRDSILGKRSDFSARAVITPNPNLKPYEIGIPRKILAQIAQPFIIHTILYGVDTDGTPFLKKWKALHLPTTVNGITNVLNAYYKDIITDEKILELLRSIIDKSVAGKVVLAKRDPALHRFNWRGMYIKPVDGYAIQIANEVTDPIGGDFDGDTMAVYMPLTEEAQTEIKAKIMYNILNPANNNLVMGLKQDVILGWYYVTNDVLYPKAKLLENVIAFDVNELIKKIEQNPNFAGQKIKYSSAKTNYKEIETTIGRVLLNLILPEEIPFLNETFNKKLAKKITQLLAQKVSEQEAIECIHKLYELGCKFATVYAPSMPIDEFKLPESFYKKVEKLKTIDDPIEGQKYLNQLLEEAKEYVKQKCPHLYAIFDSGCRGSWEDFKQMAIAKGYVTDTTGKIIPKPIAKGLIHNLTADEYFLMAPAARKGIVDRSINTAKPGYLTRRLAFAASDILLSENDDCNTTRFLKIKIDDESIAKALIGRYLANGQKITEDNYKQFIGKEIELRSPIFCKSKHICKSCYGDLWRIAKTKYIGILAAQSIGERGTQLIMKTFHTGGVAEIKSIPDLIPEKYNEFVYQTNTEIYAKKEGYFEFELNEDYQVEIYDDIVVITEGIVNIVDPQTGDFIEIVVSKGEGFALTLYFDKIQKEESVYRLYFSPESKIADITLMTADISNAIDIIEKLFEARHPKFKDAPPEKLLMEIYKYYKDFGLQLVHFEIILSNMYRSKNNILLPWRLTNDKEYVLVGIKKVPFYTSSLLALGFENVKKAIETGLLYQHQSEDNPLEKLLLGKLESI